LSKPLAQDAILKVEAFHDPGIFAAEQRAIGARHWQLIGPSRWIAEDNAWMTSRIADREVFVQRFGDRVVGFENVCSHRFAQLRGERRGIGHIQCPYHHWAFDSQGIPRGIPHCKELFGVLPHELAKRRLRPVDVRVVGELVFGRLPVEGGATLEQDFGTWTSVWTALAGRSLELFYDHEQTIKANWKLAVENTLDEYHVAAVHPKGFGSGGWLVPGQYRYEEDGTSDAMVLRRAGIDSFDAAALIAAVAEGKPLPVDYTIFHFFPDLLIVFFVGRVILVSRYEALAPDETRVRSLLFDLLPTGGKAMNGVKRNAVTQYVNQLLDEDREAVERWSKGIRQAWRPSMFGQQEQRLAHFERSWTALFGLGGPP
jgi:phenylpropionate dioxygenase-like ring-hydroxylating dioxygenase large terminal subunit